MDPLLIHKKERTYYAIALAFSIVVSLLLLITIIGIYVLIALVVIPLLAHAITMAHIRTNGVRITPNQFPEVYEIVYQQSARMGLPYLPDVYVMESSGVLNAFATRFFGRNMVVLYSDLFELVGRGGKNELAFVISHELAHLQRKHLTKQLFIVPAMWVPFIGEAYSRACEYTCDRMAAHFTEDPEAAMNGLTILAIGKSLYKQVNREEYLLQSSAEKGLFVWLAEKLSTHPPLPKRIHAIQRTVDPAAPQIFKSSNLGLIIVIVVGVMFVGALTTGIALSATIIKLADTTFEETYTDEEIYADEETHTNDLISAAKNGDTALVKELLEQGADPNEADYDGWTALMSAVDHNNAEMVNALLDADANPNMVEDAYENTALTLAVSSGYIELITLLLAFGADPNQQDSFGWTPLMTAASYGEEEAARILLQNGANRQLEDESGYTAFDYAMDAGYGALAELLDPSKGNAA